MKKLALLLAAVAVFFSCRVRLDESTVNAAQENKELELLVGGVLKEVLQSYPSTRYRKMILNDDTWLLDTCLQISYGAGMLDTLQSSLIYLTEDSKYSSKTEFLATLTKASLKYFNARTACGPFKADKPLVIKTLEEARGMLIELAKQVPNLKISEEALEPLTSEAEPAK